MWRLVVAVAERRGGHRAAPPRTPPVCPVVELEGGVVADGAPLRAAAPRVSEPEPPPVGRVEVLGVGPVPDAGEPLPEELRLPPREVGPVGPRGVGGLYGF